MDILGIRIDNLSLIEILGQIEDFIKTKKPHYIVTLNTYLLALAKNDPDYKEIILNADLVTADGMGIIFLAKFLRQPLVERISGIDLIKEICKLASFNNYRIFLLGAKQEVVKKTTEVLRLKYPYLNIVGFHNGYFKEDEEQKVIDIIRLAKPDILLVALGAPKQEVWIKKNKDIVNVPVCIGVGGSFDVIAGRLKRAPKWMQNAGLEWLYRTIQEPWRIRRLVIISNLIFSIMRGKLIKKAN